MKQMTRGGRDARLEIGTMILRSGRAARRPSIDAASRIAGGISARNERIIHTAMRRFIEVYRITSRKMLSSMLIFCAIR